MKSRYVFGESSLSTQVGCVHTLVTNKHEDVPSYTTIAARAVAVYVTASRSRLTVSAARDRRPRAAACTVPRTSHRATPRPSRPAPRGPYRPHRALLLSYRPTTTSASGESRCRHERTPSADSGHDVSVFLRTYFFCQSFRRRDNKKY